MNRNQATSGGQNNRSNINIFYYSRVSKLCIDLLRMMESYNILNKFFLKCVDDMDVNSIPKGLERVPTLIISGIDKPLVANEAVKWFNDNRPYLIQQNMNMQNKKLIYNMTKNMYGNTGPKGFSTSELVGTSDNFAYMETDEAQPKEFCRYGNDGDIIYTPPKDSKINDSSQKQLLTTAEELRKTQEKEFASVMKHDQIDKLIEKERDQLMKNRMGL